MFSSASKLMGEAIGTSDDCTIVPRERIRQESAYNQYLVPSETPYILLKSTKREFFFTSHAYYMIQGEAAVGTKRMIHRFEYADYPISNVHFETAGMGVTDFDCEIKFHVAGQFISIDVKKSETDKAAVIFRTLCDLASVQARNAKHYRLSEIALGRSHYYHQGVDASLKTEQDFTFIQTMLERFNPQDYSAVFERGLQN